MSYRKSRARVSFESSASDLLRLSRFSSLKKNGFSYDHQNLVFQSAIFRLCAAIEEYLRTFCEDLLFSCKNQGAILSEIPANLRASALLNRQSELFKSYIVQGDEIAILRNLQPTANAYRVCIDADVLTSQIRTSDILGSKKYPSLKNLKIVYNRLGIADIMMEAHKRGKKDYTNALQSFLSVREAISHQLPPPITFQDVQRHFGNVIELLNQFDRVTFGHLVRISDKKYWPS